MTRATVLAVVSEIYPLVKTGGLADVAGALPGALRPHGFDVVSLVPGYKPVMTEIKDANEVLAFADLFGGSARLLKASEAGLDLLVLDAPHLFAREGNPYLGPDGRDWPDNAVRFAALSFVAAQVALGELKAWVPAIVHAHDWQAGLTMAYLNYEGRPRPKTAMTIHNLAFQGQFPRQLLRTLRLPPHAFRMDGVEYFGSIGFLKAGLQFADRITTVSQTYADEIRTPALGFGLDGLLRHRSHVLAGIRNGIDTEVWNPRTDTRIAAHFDADSLEKRGANKAALQRRLGLKPDPGRLLFGVIGRLSWQKGLDLLGEAAPSLLDAGAQLALLGTGEAELERQFSRLAVNHSGDIGCCIGYDEDLAHLIQAGSDALLVPSRFEPCGLTQLCAERYGAVPVVAKVGGLADTVADPGSTPAERAVATGLHFSPVTREALEAALRRAAALWSDRDTWRLLQHNGMRSDVSWSGPARLYASLYADLLAAKN
jgi:starch synthase